MLDLFDAPEPVAAKATAPQPISLSSFLNAIGAVVKQNFPAPRWVQVEVSKLNNRGQHAYFDFVEYGEDGKEKAKARGSLWASRKAVLFAKFRKATGGDIQDGMKLLLLLKPDFNAQYGFSFTVEDVDPAYTLGDMQAKLQAIRDALVQAGIHDANRKLPAPYDYTRVAVVSPEGAAGLADFMREAEVLQAHGLCQFDYATAVFQGAAAAAAILDALSKVARTHAQNPYDAVVIIRGGGAAADLAWLNDLNLAKAVCLMPMPVLTGIGHQIDDTILDEVAHRRLDTPSKVSNHIAAVIISNAEAAIGNMVSIVRDVGRAVTLAETRVDSLVAAVKTSSLQAIAKAESDIQAMLERVRMGAHGAVALTEQKIQSMMSEIMGLSPRNTLARGYAVVRDNAGKPITSVAALPSGTHIRLELRDGVVPAITE